MNYYQTAKWGNYVHEPERDSPRNSCTRISRERLGKFDVAKGNMFGENMGLVAGATTEHSLA